MQYAIGDVLLGREDVDDWMIDRAVIQDDIVHQLAETFSRERLAEVSVGDGLEAGLLAERNFRGAEAADSGGFGGLHDVIRAVEQDETDEGVDDNGFAGLSGGLQRRSGELSGGGLARRFLRRDELHVLGMGDSHLGDQE